MNRRSVDTGSDVMSTDGSLRWRWCRFEALGVVELQHIYAARQQVFAIEQQCIYLDVDGYDEAAYHLAAWSDAHRMPLAYARLLDPGVKYAEPSMGRVITTAPARGTGLGRELVRRVIAASAVCLAKAWDPDLGAGAARTVLSRGRFRPGGLALCGGRHSRISRCCAGPMPDLSATVDPMPLALIGTPRSLQSQP